jgi:hypothetical protein
MVSKVTNPGSALGEAIGAQMELALNKFLGELVEDMGYHFLSKGIRKNKSGTQKKLLLYDKFGTEYNIDSVIADEAMHPIILIESKYIRYKKHNRDKGSWICTAHPAIRRHYASVRSSIAVLAGNWSLSSQAMMRSHDVNLLLISFQSICDLLKRYGMDFNWVEKHRTAAMKCWRVWVKLNDRQRGAVGMGMVNLVKPELEKLVIGILDDKTPREIERVTIELSSNLGEVRAFEFDSVDDAIDFLNVKELKAKFIETDSKTLFDPKPFADDSDEFETQ